MQKVTLREITKPLEDYLQFEHYLKNYDAGIKGLKTEYDQLLKESRYGDAIDISLAPTVINKYLEIEKYKSQHEEVQQKLNELTENIKEYIKALGGAWISGRFMSPKEGALNTQHERTYTFFIDKGQLKHNHQDK